MVEIPPPPGSLLFKPRWAESIKKVSEADPVLCPRCGGGMAIIAFLDQPDVIEKSSPTWGCGLTPPMLRPPSMVA